MEIASRQIMTQPLSHHRLTILQGEHIELHPFQDPLTDSQAARVYRWSCDEALLRWSGGVATDLSFSEFSRRLRNDSQNASDFRHAFFIFTRDGELIGRIGVFAIDWSKHDGELGIVIGETTSWNKGYGRQAVTLLLHHLFSATTLERIYLYTFPENQRAQKCFAACGFRTLGIVRHLSPDLGEFDGLEMEITRREFLQGDARIANQIQIRQDAK